MNPGVAQRRSFSDTCWRRTQIKRVHTHNTARALYQIAVRHFYGQVTHNNTDSTCGIITLLMRLRICQNHHMTSTLISACIDSTSGGGL